MDANADSFRLRQPQRHRRGCYPPVRSFQNKCSLRASRGQRAVSDSASGILPTRYLLKRSVTASAHAPHAMLPKARPPHCRLHRWIPVQHPFSRRVVRVSRKAIARSITRSAGYREFLPDGAPERAKHVRPLGVPVAGIPGVSQGSATLEFKLCGDFDGQQVIRLRRRISGAALTTQSLGIELSVAPVASRPGLTRLHERLYAV
jgi:hypothetical protein